MQPPIPFGSAFYAPCESLMTQNSFHMGTPELSESRMTNGRSADNNGYLMHPILRSQPVSHFNMCDMRSNNLEHQEQRKMIGSPSEHDHTHQAQMEPSHSKRARTKDEFQAEPLDLGCFSKLAELSVDALAQIEKSSGGVLWCNIAFSKLARDVGLGDPAAGVRHLTNCL